MLPAVVLLAASTAVAPAPQGQWLVPVEQKTLGLGWYAAPIVAHGIDVLGTRYAIRKGASELSADVYGERPSLRRLVRVKAPVVGGQLVAIFVLDRVLHKPDAAKTISAFSIWPTAAGGWNFAVTLGH